MTQQTKLVIVLGWVGVVLASLMYLSLIDQIYLNLDGRKGSWMLPLVGTFSSTIWTLYGFMKAPRDYPIMVCNVLGIPLTSAALITTFYF